MSALPKESYYTPIAVTLHWLIALMIGFNLTLGWFMEGFPPALKMVVLALHISSGFTVLVLTLIRIVWRLLNAPPAMEVNPLERGAAHIVHFLLYAGMVLMPLTGWAILSAHPAPDTSGFVAEQAAMAAKMPLSVAGGPKPPAFKPGIRAWWVIPVPSLSAIQAVGETPQGLPAQHALHRRFVDWHKLGGWVMLALLCLHIGGALKHQIIDRQPFLQRMTWKSR